jgi:predicted RNA binding protein YcfA (HicA-like mRNA interferase family)
MPRKIRALRRDLRQAGWSIKRQSGSHQRWHHPLVPDLKITIAGADGADAKPYMEQQIREGVQRAKAAEQQKGNHP